MDFGVLLLTAAANADVSLAQKVLVAGTIDKAEVNQAAHVAIMHGDCVEFIKELHQAGFELGKSVLWAACREGREGIVGLMLSNGAEWDKVTEDICQRQGHTHILRKLKPV